MDDTLYLKMLTFLGGNKMLMSNTNGLFVYSL